MRLLQLFNVQSIAGLLVVLAALFAVFAARQRQEIDRNPNLRCDWLKEVKRTNTWINRDQQVREKYSKLANERKLKGIKVTKEETLEIMREFRQVDIELQTELEDFVHRCGWPNRSYYGPKAGQHAYLIVLHSNGYVQDHYYPMMAKAVKADELQRSHLAQLEDRILLGKGKRQIYGTQLISDVDGTTISVAPLKDDDNLAAIDKRRSEAGFTPASFCAYLSLFDPTPKHHLCE